MLTQTEPPGNEQRNPHGDRVRNWQHKELHYGLGCPNRELRTYRSEVPARWTQEKEKRGQSPTKAPANDLRQQLNTKRVCSSSRADDADHSVRHVTDSRLQKLQQSPFVREIRDTLPPRNFTTPKFTKYDATHPLPTIDENIWLWRGDDMQGFLSKPAGGWAHVVQPIEARYNQFLLPARVGVRLAL